MTRLIFLLAIITAIALDIPAQSKYHGTVVDVVDGKTVVLSIPNGKMRVTLQYIEVPEPDQQLHQIVVDHLGALTRGKEADFSLVGLASNGARGRLVIDGVDISQQMLRDGAAWLVPSERSGQAATDFNAYKASEDQAKSDKLGVWSVKDLKPAWQFRAEQQEKLRAQQEAQLRSRGVRSGLGPYQSNAKPGELNNQKMAAFDRQSWFEWIADMGTETPGVHSYSDPQKRFQAFYTSNAVIDFSAGNIKEKLDCRAVYYLLNAADGTHKGVYTLMFTALSDDYNFSRRASRLTISAGGRVISAHLFHGVRAKASAGAEEVFFYRLSRESLKEIANADVVQVRIDNLSGRMSKNGQELIMQLVAGN